MPAAMTILNPPPDEESDSNSNISLDLQVSELDESEKDKFEDNLMEVEDEEAILNKYEGSEGEKSEDSGESLPTESENKNETTVEKVVAPETEPSIENTPQNKETENEDKHNEEDKKEEEDELPESNTLEENLNCDKNIDNSSIVDNEINKNSSNNKNTNNDLDNNVNGEDVGDSDLMEIDEECTKNESIKEVNISAVADSNIDDTSGLDETLPLIDEDRITVETKEQDNDSKPDNTLSKNTDEKSNLDCNVTNIPLITASLSNVDDSKADNESVKTTSNVKVNHSHDKKKQNISAKPIKRTSINDSNQINDKKVPTKLKRSKSNKYDGGKTDTYEISETKEVKKSSRKQESVPILTIRRSTRRRKLSNASEESTTSESVSETSEKNELSSKSGDDTGKKIIGGEITKVKPKKIVNNMDKENKINKSLNDISLCNKEKLNENIIDNDVDVVTDKSKELSSLENDSIGLNNIVDITSNIAVLSDKTDDLKEDSEDLLEKLDNDTNDKIDEDAGPKEDSDEHDGEDLLLVMDEKSPDAHFPEDEEENSSSEDKGEKETDDIIRDQEVQDPTSPVDDTMDIEDDLLVEETNIDSTTDTLNTTTVIQKSKTDTEMTDDDTVDIMDNESGTNSSTNKPTSLLAKILKKGQDSVPDMKDSTTKSTKRSLASSSLDVEESSKKLKLSPTSKTEPCKYLGDFKQFILSRGLERITRAQLEDFCIQKFGESINQRSEIAELKLKVKAAETALDTLRKETILLSKQTRDLNIVHQKVLNDLMKIAENPDRPLIVPKITRSVGLQAVVRDEIKKKIIKVLDKPTKAGNPNLLIRSPTKQNGRFGPNNNTVQKNPLQTKTVQTQVVTKVKTATIVPKKPDGDNKGVIDLTDEDDKKVVNKPVKLNMINTQPGHKLVMMPNGQAVMVKLASPGVVPQPILRTVQTPTNGISRTITTSQAVRQPAKPVISTTPTRPRAPNTLPNRIPARAAVPLRYSKHPAPLPHPPAIKPDVKSNKPVPPKPQLMLNKTPCGTGIVLSWKMPYKLDMFEEIASYQLYAYQETKAEPRTDNWGKIGDVKALELPMAVTLTQFAVGNRYFFAVRAVDILSRHGAFSESQTILL